MSARSEADANLGAFVEFRGRMWKIAYRGPVYHAENDHLGLVECTTSNSSTSNSTVAASGTCNGTVDGVTYFICEEYRGLLIPTCDVFSTLSETPQSRTNALSNSLLSPASPAADDEHNLSGSIGGLVFGPQSVKKLRDESQSASLPIGSSSTHLSHPATSPLHMQSHRSLVSTDAATEPDNVMNQYDGAALLIKSVDQPKPLTSVPLVARLSSSSCSEEEANLEVQRFVKNSFQPLEDSLARSLLHLEFSRDDEQRWLESTKSAISALQECFSWSHVRAPSPDQTITSGSLHSIALAHFYGNSEDAQKNSRIGRLTSSTIEEITNEIQPLSEASVATAVTLLLQQRPTLLTDVPSGEIPHHIVSKFGLAHNKRGCDAMELLRDGLTPLLREYTHSLYVGIDPSWLQSQLFDEIESSKPSKQVPTTVEGSVAQHRFKKEMLRRLQFSIEAAVNESKSASEEGNIPQLEIIGHRRVDCSQALQRVSAELAHLVDQFQQNFVESSRSSFRDCIRKSEQALDNDVAPKLKSQLEDLEQQILACEESLGQRRESFVREAFRNSNAMIEHVQRVTQLDAREGHLMEEIRARFQELNEVRTKKIEAMLKVKTLQTEREASFETHHTAAASMFVDRVDLELQQMVLKRIVVQVEKLKQSLLPEWREKEEATLMALQRILFEEKTAAHQKHLEAFREVCLAVEDLAFRKEQAHHLICDRLDRTKMELELAADSLNANGKGIALEVQELDRVAKELFCDISAIRSIASSSGAVFEASSGKFLLECGKQVQDPREEVKRISLDRKDNLRQIAGELPKALAIA